MKSPCIQEEHRLEVIIIAFSLRFNSGNMYTVDLNKRWENDENVTHLILMN